MVSPHDLAGKIWGAWAAELQTWLVAGGVEVNYSEMGFQVCWTYGQVQGSDGGDFRCAACEERGGLRLGIPRVEEFSLPDAVQAVFGEYLSLWSAAIRRELLVQFVQFVTPLGNVRGRIKRRTWVTVLILLPSSTLIATHEGHHRCAPLPPHTAWESPGQWILKGDICGLCGRFVAHSAVVLRPGTSPLGLCTGRQPQSALVKREWSQRSSLGCGSISLRGGVPIQRQKDTEPPDLSLPEDEDGACAAWVRQFAPH